MAKKNNLLDFIKRQIEIEKEIAGSLNKALKDVRNQPVKGVLEGISLDSLKHAEMYDSA
jgi:rubrerythrin